MLWSGLIETEGRKWNNNVFSYEMSEGDSKRDGAICCQELKYVSPK